jgi:transcriptional regulator with XRE-family HTH domain
MLNKNVSSTVNKEALRLLNMSSLQDRIKLALGHARINASTLAKRAKVSRATVSLWVNGPTQTIEGDNLTRAATVLGVNAHWLSTGEGVPFSDEDPPRAESPQASYNLGPGGDSITVLLETLRDEINQQPEVVRNCIAQLITSYLIDHNPDIRSQAADAIRRLVAK